MPPIRTLDESFAVAPQLAGGDLRDVRAAGFRTVINNRPDGEESDQPGGDDLRAAAGPLGLDWHAIPVGARGITPRELDATRAVMRDAGGPILAFCRSGTRSCHLWALARAAEGDLPDTLIAKAAAAGYDLRGLAPALAALALR